MYAKRTPRHSLRTINAVLVVTLLLCVAPAPTPKFIPIRFHHSLAIDPCCRRLQAGVDREERTDLPQRRVGLSNKMLRVRGSRRWCTYGESVHDGMVERLGYIEQSTTTYEPFPRPLPACVDNVRCGNEYEEPPLLAKAIFSGSAEST